MTVQTQKAQDRPSTDRIERRIELRASRARVWRAIANATEFGAWFGIKLEGAFAAGATIRGRLTIPNYDHLTLEMQVERIEPERYFSYRWHPYAIDPKVDRTHYPGRIPSRRDRGWGGHRRHDRRVRLRSHPARAPGGGLPHE